MINRLIKYKGLPNNEKIYYLQQSLQDFDQYFKQAQQAKQKITDFIEKSHPHPSSSSASALHKEGVQTKSQSENHLLMSGGGDHHSLNSAFDVFANPSKDAVQSKAPTK